MDVEPQPKYAAGGSGIHRPLGGAGRDSGADYKSKKGNGDVTRSGRANTYVYIPLMKEQLNHRKRTKLRGQFKGLVRRRSTQGARL